MRSIVSSQLSVFNYLTASNRIALNRFYQHASFLVSYRAHVSRYESDRLFHERFTPLIFIVISDRHSSIRYQWDVYNKDKIQTVLHFPGLAIAVLPFPFPSISIHFPQIY